MKVAPVAPVVAYVIFVIAVLIQTVWLSVPAAEVNVIVLFGVTVIVPVAVTCSAASCESYCIVKRT